MCVQSQCFTIILYVSVRLFHCVFIIPNFASISVKPFRRYGRFSGILDLFYACWDHPRRVFNGICDCAKFGRNRRSNFDLFCSVLQPSSIRRLAIPWTYFLHLSLSSLILIDSSMDSPVHVICVVHPGRAWSSSPACTWHCSLHYLFLQATPLFPNGVTIVC